MRSETVEMKGPPNLCEGYKDHEPPKQHNNTSSMANRSVDFSEFMWMGEELEEFDRKVQQELMEQELIDMCFEQMLAEECHGEVPQEGWYYPEQYNAATPESQVASQMEQLSLDHKNEYNSYNGTSAYNGMQSQFQGPPVHILSSKLNPNAPEFVPRSHGADR